MTLSIRTTRLFALAGLFLAAPVLALPPIQPEALALRQAHGSAPIVIDVRTREEYEAGHVPGAVLIPHDEVDARIRQLKPWEGREIVVYCRSGRRSQIAEDRMRALGLTNVRQLDGSWQNWERYDLPVQTRATEVQR